MSYIRETFYCVNDSTKNIHLRGGKISITFMLTLLFFKLKYTDNIS